MASSHSYAITAGAGYQESDSTWPAALSIRSQTQNCIRGDLRYSSLMTTLSISRKFTPKSGRTFLALHDDDA